MIVIIKNKPEVSQLESLKVWLRGMGLEIFESQGAHSLILGLVGDTSIVDISLIRSLDIVEDVKRIQEPYKNVNRKFHPEDTIIDVRGVKIGAGNMALIAGPCSVESEDQIISIAKSVKASGANMLRGGAFKPRTSPYAFQGMKQDGLQLLIAAREETGLPIVSEIMDLSQLEHFADIDVLQVGARNMQNFTLLRELGKVGKPILLKRGLSSTVEEFLMSAEYLMAGGCTDIILCERGIRTFETATRNTLDLGVIPLIKELTHLPIVVDPSHATGIARLVPPLSIASIAAGADGLLIEVHNDPEHALCDGAQSLTPATFDTLAKKIERVRGVLSE